MSLRPAAQLDVPAVAALEQGCFGVDAWSTASVLSEVVGPGRAAVVAEHDGEIVGYALVAFTGDVADLQRIAVQESHRRAGLGRALLAAALAAAADGGAGRVLLEVSDANAAACAFYAADGFSVVDRRRRYYRDGTDALVMARALRGPRSEPGHARSR